MRFPLLLLLLSFTVALPSTVLAIDYAKVDRMIKREPSYESDKPLYALLLFGREAAIRVWVVLDGKTIYIDRNGDGDLTGRDEQFAKTADCHDIAIGAQHSKSRYNITSVSCYPREKPPGHSLMVDLDITGENAYQQYCDAFMDEDPRRAAIAHFDGPLAVGPVTIFWKVPQTLSLSVGEEPTDLRALVGTMDEQYKCWVVVRSHRGESYAFGDGITPLVDVDFPPNTPSGPRVKRRYMLNQFC